MFKSWADKVNGYGVLFRFITPLFQVLLTIIITLAFGKLSDIQKTQDELRFTQKELKVYHENHLEHHRQSEIKIEGRLACIETELRRLK